MAAAAGVEPPALAYIRHLVEELEDTAFEDACFDQADEFNDGDLFDRRPEPSEVPAAVARALDGVEDLLWKGAHAGRLRAPGRPQPPPRAGERGRRHRGRRRGHRRGRRRPPRRHRRQAPRLRALRAAVLPATAPASPP